MIIIPYCSCLHLYICEERSRVKYTGKIVDKWIQNSNIKVLEWPSQSPDLYRIENLWKNVTFKVHGRKPTNIIELDVFAKEEWSNISDKTCKKMVPNFNKSLVAVLLQKGYTIDY
jgi:hypothetical protein